MSTTAIILAVSVATCGLMTGYSTFRPHLARRRIETLVNREETRRDLRSAREVVLGLPEAIRDEAPRRAGLGPLSPVDTHGPAH